MLDGGAVPSWLVCSSPDWAVLVWVLVGDAVVFLGKTLSSNSTSLHPGVWMGINELLGNLTICWGLASCPGGVEIILATSCYRDWDKLWQLWASQLQSFTLLHMLDGPMMLLVMNLPVADTLHTQSNHLQCTYRCKDQENRWPKPSWQPWSAHLCIQTATLWLYCMTSVTIKFIP